MNSRLFIISLTLALTGAFTFAADPPKPAKPAKPAAPDAKPPANDASLDDLLKLPTDRKPDAKKPEPVNPAAKKPTDGNDPGAKFMKAVEEMAEAGQRLAVQQDAGLDTQRIQESILRRLDDVIAAAQQQQQQQQQQQASQQKQQQKQETGSQQNSQKQQGEKPGDQKSQKGQENKGQPSRGEVGEQKPLGGPIEETRVEWGRLPPRLRTELDQGLSEKFSTIYKRLTEAYYRRLAEESRE